MVILMWLLKTTLLCSGFWTANFIFFVWLTLTNKKDD